MHDFVGAKPINLCLPIANTPQDVIGVLANGLVDGKRLSLELRKNDGRCGHCHLGAVGIFHLIEAAIGPRLLILADVLEMYQQLAGDIPLGEDLQPLLGGFL